MNELVSIIIPTYKGYETLARAIDSALIQTYKNIEILVIDDNTPGSKDRSITEELMSKYSDIPYLYYIKRDSNGGCAAAKNTGIYSSKGYYISFLDDDDYYIKDRIEKCVDYLSKNKKMIGVYTGVNIYNSDNRLTLRLRPDHNLSIHDILMNEMTLGTGSNDFIKMEYIKKIGGHDETFLRRTDLEFMIRLCKTGTIGYISECLVIKSTNSTDNIPPYNKMKTNLQKYINKFKDDINNLGFEKKEFFYRHYKSLLYIAIRDNNPVSIKESYRLVKRYGRVDFKTRVITWLYIHNLRNKPIIGYLFNLLKHLKSYKQHA